MTAHRTSRSCGLGTGAHTSGVQRLPSAALFPPRSSVLLAGVALSCWGLAAVASTNLVPFGATWRYLDTGSDPGPAWTSSAFNDSGWAAGPAELGYGDGDEATTVAFGPNSANKRVTTFFRHRFFLADPSSFASASIGIVRDDGAAVYVNGTEVIRDNMPAAPEPITAATYASTTISYPDESATNVFPIPVATLVAGSNVVAVEIHQASPDSSDISFDLRLKASAGVSITRGPYLQMATTNSIVVRWRTDAATDGRVTFGTNAASLDREVSDGTITTEHVVTITNLSPGTPYLYAVGTSSGMLASGPDFVFRAAPRPGAGARTRIWVIGDSGTADGVAQAVRDAYLTAAGSSPSDVWLMLGDNAYETGSDVQYQAAVFDTYPTILRNTVVWPTFGNHDSYTLDGAPYFDAFTLPKNGEAGGVPSDTEKYYSFDHGDIHFICLDSQGSSRSAQGAMLQWLASDLAAASRNWIIAYWHHPPYTKGSHDSDTETELVEMREGAVPLLEAGGVDLVLGGHSHAYERSALIDGFYSTPTTAAGGIVLSPGGGREEESGAYQKPNATGRAGAIYAVMGSSGRLGPWVGGSEAITNPVPHPVMFTSLRYNGSLLIDVDGDRLDARFIDSSGGERDHFTLLKGSTIHALAPDPSASEYEADPGALRMTRTGAIGFPIVVNCGIGGSASNGIDYATLDATHHFPAGVASIDITVNPLPDPLAEGDEGVTLTLVPDASYSLGPTNSASVLIRDRPLDGWRKAAFGSSADDPAVGAPLADPDNDGIPNVAEYAMRLDPRAFDASPALSVTGDELRFRFPRNGDALDVSLLVEESRSLIPDDWTAVASFAHDGPWTVLAPHTGVTESGSAPNLWTTVIRTNRDALGERHFFRLRVAP